ncbi:MAG: ATP-binding cassette domain-containing protein, partial [Candidatus Bathyarchaeota archaeon]|nr:ATP-binding cassette domain-containing protein [Candidatus Bathyarchaeota archaeon]
MLKVENVSKHWGNFAISNVSFACKEEEYVVIMGPSGAGKTLLLQLIAGIEHPDDGKILINGVDVTNFPPEKREVGYVPQKYALFPHLNVYENIAYGLKARKLSNSEIDEKVRDLSRQFKIEHLLNRYPTTLSGGEQQRVAIARALVIKPKILLLDEPLSALDLKTREDLRSYLRMINRKFKVPVI